MSPRQILEALAEVYASCGTYRDSGQVITRFHSPGEEHPRTVVIPFTTAFHRPDRFRFEHRVWREIRREWNRYIVWLGGEAVRTGWDVRPGVREPESLELALAGATGVSGGSAHTVPALLMPDRIGGWRLTELAELASLGDEPLDRVTCYRISGRFVRYPLDQTEDEQLSQQAIALGRRWSERAEHSPRRSCFSIFRKPPDRGWSGAR